MDLGEGGEVDGVGLAPPHRLAGGSQFSRDDAIKDGRHLRENRFRVGPWSQRDIAITILGMPAKFGARAVAICNRRIWQEHIAVELRVVRYVLHDAGYLQRDHSAKARAIS